MIILIGGASHTGKTVLAQRLLEKYGYPYLSIDHLKMGLIRSGQTALTPMDDDKLTDYLWLILIDFRHAERRAWSRLFLRDRQGEHSVLQYC